MRPQSSDFILLDLYPEHGAYFPGQPVKLILELESTIERSATLQLTITKGVRVIDDLVKKVALSTGLNWIDWKWNPPLEAPCGYGAEMEIVPIQKEEPRQAHGIETAFDVLPDWTVFPRYGFLCDFSPDRTDAAETLQALSKYHINGIQFYDWQYRHDHLVPDEDQYVDPLGRLLSLKTIRYLIDQTHSHGMAAMPYLAVYAASVAFWRKHPDWALYDYAGKPIAFGEDFLGLMNPTPGMLWQRHLLDECSRVLASLSFDGLHVDQYGEPKIAFDASGRQVDLPDAFEHFVQAVAKEHPGKPVLFNAVGNWPIENLAKSPTAFNYIEIWPPDTSYLDLVRIVRNARRLSGEKPVVVALYIPAERVTNIRLANALIHSAGGSRIQLGENERLLSDPYFPKHAPLSEDLRMSLRRSADFVVRYSDWFGPSIPETSGIACRVPAGVETFIRQTGQGWCVNLVNLVNMQASHWNEDHTAPQPLFDFGVELDLPCEIQHISKASSDGDSLKARQVEFTQRSGSVQVKIARLDFWNVLFLETKQH
jgi:dextranase